MGCWSESCAVSGVEIPMSNECYALTLATAHSGWLIVVPPVKGSYDDYGGINLVEDLTEFGFTKGSNWRPVEDMNRGIQMFVDAAVFDFLKEIVPEFVYGDSPKTIGEGWTRQRAKLVEVLEKWIEIRDSDEDNHTKAINRMTLRMDRDVFGYGDRCFKDDQTMFSDAIADGKTVEQLEPLIEAYGRCYVFNWAMRELRKMPTPGSISGPQHGGSQAIIPFYAFVRKLAQKRQAEGRDEMWNFDEFDKDFPLKDWQEAVVNGETQLSFRDWQIEKGDA